MSVQPEPESRVQLGAEANGGEQVSTARAGAEERSSGPTTSRHGCTDIGTAGGRCNCCNAAIARLIFRLPTSRMRMGSRTLCRMSSRPPARAPTAVAAVTSPAPNSIATAPLLVDIRNDKGGGFMVEFYRPLSPVASPSPTRLPPPPQTPQQVAKPAKVGFLSVAYSCTCCQEWQLTNVKGSGNNISHTQSTKASHGAGLDEGNLFFPSLRGLHVATGFRGQGISQLLLCFFFKFLSFVRYVIRPRTTARALVTF